MKKLFIILFGAILSINSFAQAPQSFKYQAVLRNSNGDVKANQSVTIAVSILQTSTSGTVVYSETFSATTNAYGIVNLNIGQGTVVSGTFSGINWASGTYYVKISVDGTEMGTSQLLSVPYALYAQKAGNGFSGSYTDLTNKPNFTNWDKDSTDNINKPSGAVSGNLLYYDGNNWIAKRIATGITGSSGNGTAFSIRNPYLALSFQICVAGIYPTRDMGAEDYIGSIGIFSGNFTVTNFLPCNGQTLSISSNTALFSILGTTYGGNGTTTFNLPDLRGRAPIQYGAGAGLNTFTLGQSGGNETQTLTTSNLPSHSHTFTVSYE